MSARSFSDGDLARLADLIVAELRSTWSRARRDRAGLMADVAVVVSEHPGLSANTVAAQVPARRQDVPWCLREVEGVRTRFRTRPNQVDGEGFV